jgi:hypothetical protein
VAVGGTTGQVLQKLSATNYDTGWLTLPADFILSVTSPLAVASGVLSVDLSAYSTTAQAAALYYPLSGNPSAFLVAADITGKADLASPTFTGTPTLPTGTIATTQSPGNNTTALATTAFVTAAVPVIATLTESQLLSSLTKVMSPFDTLAAIMSENYRPALAFTGASSGVGASTNIVSLAYSEIVTPSVSVAGYAYVMDNSFRGFSTTSSSANTVVFNRPMMISGIYNTGNATYQGDANTENKVYLGTNMGSGDDPTSACIGWWKQGGASTPFNLMVHNGTTLTKVASGTSTVNSGTPFRWMVYSDGTGNVTLYINGVSVATTTAGPSGSTQSNVCKLTAATKATASAATRMAHEFIYPKIYVAPQ